MLECSSPRRQLTFRLTDQHTLPPTHDLSPCYLWLIIAIRTDDHRSDAEILQLCPHTAPAIHKHLSRCAPAAGAEAVPAQHHRRAAPSGLGVAQLVHEHVAMRIPGAR